MNLRTVLVLTKRKSVYRELDQFQKIRGFEKRSQAIQFLLDIEFILDHAAGGLITMLQLNGFTDLDFNKFTREILLDTMKKSREKIEKMIGVDKNSS